MKPNQPVSLRRPISIWIAGSVQECIDDATTGLVDAIVTNPTVLANWCEAGGTLRDCFDRLLAETNLPIFVQTRALDAHGVVAEADEMLSRSSRLIPKLPSTFAGLEATRKLARAGVTPLITTICTLRRALMFAAAGAGSLCPYFSRLSEAGSDPIELLRVASRQLAAEGCSCPLMPASIRTPEQIDDAMAAGAHGVIIFHGTFRTMLSHDVADRSLADFERDDWPRVRQ